MDANEPRSVDATFRSLLSLGLAAGTDRRHELVERLESRGGARFVAGALGDAAYADLGDLQEILASGAGVEVIVAVKAHAKEAFRRAAGAEAQHRHLLVYYLAIAAALKHHRRWTSSVDRERLVDAMLDLASVLPDPWCSLLCEASRVEPAEPGGPSA